ncbi:MAG: glycosyltransferase family 4 protein [Actinomycetia bacterium]|nr:glycosyltransferase family 4 protein [Actinomycetes bacterium]
MRAEASPDADLAVVVQADAVGQLPAGTRAIVRPVTSGGRRVIDGLRPVGPADLVHGLDVDLPIRARAPRVTTVHDLAVFDTPEAFSRYRAAGERRLIARAIRLADEVISVSRFTAERIEVHFGRSATVIPLAPAPPAGPDSVDGLGTSRLGGGSVDHDDPPDHRDLLAGLDLPDRFVLQVATIEPRKDASILAQACKRIGAPLVLAGAVDPRCRIPEGVHHLGRVSDHHRDLLMEAADIVAYISHYEGFGLPPVEAMARGRTVVATAVGALPDVVGDGARLVQPGDEEELAQALHSLWHDAPARAELGRAARAAAARLSWRQTAATTLDVYRRLGVAV